MFKCRSLTDLFGEIPEAVILTTPPPFRLRILVVSQHFPSAFEFGFGTLDNVSCGIVVDIDYQQSVRSLAHR